MANELRTPIRGKDKILYFRLLEDEAKENAGRLALQTEHEWSYERDNEQIQTKDGAIVQDGGLTVSLEINAISTRDELNKMLRKAAVEGLKVEVWEIDLADNQEGNKFGAVYAQGNLNEWTVPASVEELEELSTSMSIDGRPQSGIVELTDDEVKEISAVYSFRDLKPYNGGDSQDEE